MPARKNRLHSLEVRDRISTTMLVTRLNCFALGKRRGKDPCLFTPQQLRAAEILLDRVLPRLQTVDATVRGDPNAPLHITTTDGKL